MIGCAFYQLVVHASVENGSGEGGDTLWDFWDFFGWDKILSPLFGKLITF